MIESWVDFVFGVVGGAAAFLCLFDGTRRLCAYGVHGKAVLMTVLAAGICALYGGFAYWKYSDLKATLSANQRKAVAAQPELEQAFAREKGDPERRASAPDVHGVRNAGKLRRSRRRDQDLCPDPGRYDAARARGDLLLACGILGSQQLG